MLELKSTVTTKGQVTIPIEIRRLLGVAPHDTVIFTLEGDRVHLRRSGSVIERTAGAAKSAVPYLPPAEERAAAEEAIAAETLERMAD